MPLAEIPAGPLGALFYTSYLPSCVLTHAVKCIHIPQEIVSDSLKAGVAPFPASFVLTSLVLFFNDLHGRAAKDPGLAISQILALWPAGYMPLGKLKPVLTHVRTHIKHATALLSLLSSARLTRLPASVHYSSKQRC